MCVMKFLGWLMMLRGLRHLGRVASYWKEAIKSCVQVAFSRPALPNPRRRAANVFFIMVFRKVTERTIRLGQATKMARAYSGRNVREEPTGPKSYWWEGVKPLPFLAHDNGRGENWRFKTSNMGAVNRSSLKSQTKREILVVAPEI
jgi:hypothetical protein